MERLSVSEHYCVALNKYLKKYHIHAEYTPDEVNQLITQYENGTLTKELIKRRWELSLEHRAHIRTFLDEHIGDKLKS